MPVHLCFVCLGNICRSPTAEGVMRWLVDEAGLAEHLRVDSAGTAAWHVGEHPDERSAAAALERGVQLTGEARQFHPPDFGRFDYVLAMDRENLAALSALAPDTRAAEKVVLLRSHDPDAGSDLDVPDPYDGGPSGFDRVFEICESACRGLLAQLRAEHGF